jgi:hypothetical protein
VVRKGSAASWVGDPAGSLIWGWLDNRHSKKDMLALLYALRALTFVMFLALPLLGSRCWRSRRRSASCGSAPFR